MTTLRNTFLSLTEWLDAACGHIDDSMDAIPTPREGDDARTYERLERASILVRTVGDVLAEMLGTGGIGDPLTEKIVAEAKAAAEEIPPDFPERNTTTCWGCGEDFPDGEMTPRPCGAGEYCPKCAEKNLEYEEADSDGED